ncbi:MAG: Zn-dependent hydrolase [Alphaproteobacteria bacterium]|nr:Zn-dependent hydrolase [Alphaproteobacteria bacterium]
MRAGREPAQGVDERRLWQRHEAMARFGATARGGVNRQALSAEDIAARRTLADWAAARGYRTCLDEIGNLYVRRPGTDDTAAPVLTGSHLDSQPTGGRFDGTYGVLAGFEVLEALEDTGTRTRRAIEVVAWTNEEGSRFQPGTMGSAVFAGDKKLADMVEVRDSKGTRLGDALAETLAAMPDADRRKSGFPVAAYIEAHIEQGPRLALEDKTIGVVTGIQGSRWFEIVVTGEEAHAGTTPLGARKDAFRSALAMAQALQELMHDPADILRFTIGRFEVMPGSPNTVPGRVLFTIDFRHPDREVLRERGGRIAAICKAAAGPCQVSIRETTSNDPTHFDPAVVDLVRQSAAHLGLPHMDIFSGAGHDARYMAPLCPTGMIFVPCEKGISHNEAENATPGDLAAGARVLADVLVRLANR